jgi:hypothetical protein
LQKKVQQQCPAVIFSASAARKIKVAANKTTTFSPVLAETGVKLFCTVLKTAMFFPGINVFF